MKLLEIFDNRACELGEGALWHPLRKEFFWFDIVRKRMFSRGQSGAREWQFDEMCSAAGWIDIERMIVASESALWQLWLDGDRRVKLCDLEATNTVTRSNDGRVDPYGGFWISTMGKTAEAGAGSIWRWHRGELRRLFTHLTIPNSICFDKSGAFGYFSDTHAKRVMRVGLDVNGWPINHPETWLCLRQKGLNPDGAVIDASGLFWVALWGTGSVSAYGPGGTFVREIHVPAPQVSCPTFGGEDLDILFCTSAFQGQDVQNSEVNPKSGMTFSGKIGALGRAESRLLLS